MINQFESYFFKHLYYNPFKVINIINIYIDYMFAGKCFCLVNTKCAETVLNFKATQLKVCCTFA